MFGPLLRAAAHWRQPAGCTTETAPHDPCPVCGQFAAVLAGAADRRGRPLRTVACLSCGLFRSDPLPAAEELQRFYESQYRLEYKGVRRPKRKHVYRAAKLAALRRRWLGDALRPGETALDIGCGSGEWLYVLKSSGLSPTGIEIDAHYAEFGRQEYGVDIRTGSLWSVEMAAAFDILTLFHVLEHLPNPVESLEHVRGWTKDGGLLAIEVPNAASPNQHPAKRFHPAHVVGFTPGSLALAVARSGWLLTHLFLDRHERNIFAMARNGGGNESQCPPRPLDGVASAPPGAAAYYLRRNTYLRWLERMVQFSAEYGAAFRRSSPRQMVDWLSRTR
jgi:2-polyprenyl-3-methyl-5-hydroxy-6-metoxy-1,4-benzoquinol methylase